MGCASQEQGTRLPSISNAMRFTHSTSSRSAKYERGTCKWQKVVAITQAASDVCSRVTTSVSGSLV